MRIGDSAPEPLPDGGRPLSRIRVIDLTRVLAGPTCARTLAEHSADVLRVGSPNLPNNEAMLRDTGFGKRSAALELQAVSGIADEHASGGRPRFAPANPLDYTAGYLAAFGAMVALRRRAREGGSYQVRVSLAQAGRWLASLPRVSASGVATDLPAERLEQLMMVSDTPFGRLRHLAPVAQMSETQPHWDKPSVPLDHDPPEWR